MFAAVHGQLVVSTTCSYNVTIPVLSRIHGPRYGLEGPLSGALSIVSYNSIIGIVILAYRRPDEAT
jgi:hypothetical protein